MCIVELSKKLRVGTLFNPIIFYIFYLIIKKKIYIYLRVGTCPPWPYARSAHASMLLLLILILSYFNWELYMLLHMMKKKVGFLLVPYKLCCLWRTQAVKSRVRYQNPDSKKQKHKTFIHECGFGRNPMFLFPKKHCFLKAKEKRNKKSVFEFYPFVLDYRSLLLPNFFSFLCEASFLEWFG